MIKRQIYICKGLRLYALGSIHHQYRAVTGRQCPADLIIKVHMSRGIYKIKNILLAVFSFIYGAHSLGLYGYAPLTLQIHIVQHLFLHLTLGQQACFLYDTVCQRGLAMVDMRHYAEISDVFLLGHYYAPIHSLFCYIRSFAALRMTNETYNFKMLTYPPFFFKIPRRIQKGLPQSGNPFIRC